MISEKEFFADILMLLVCLARNEILIKSLSRIDFFAFVRYRTYEFLFLLLLIYIHLY